LSRDDRFTSTPVVSFAQIAVIRDGLAGGGAGWVVVLGFAAAEGPMTETRKLAAILVSDVAGYSRLAGADEDRTLARLRTLRSDLIDPIISYTTDAWSSALATARSSSSAA
jgi:class 3 adenylate cyclase